MLQLVLRDQPVDEPAVQQPRPRLKGDPIEIVEHAGSHLVAVAPRGHGIEQRKVGAIASRVAEGVEI